MQYPNLDRVSHSCHPDPSTPFSLHVRATSQHSPSAAHQPDEVELDQLACHSNNRSNHRGEINTDIPHQAPTSFPSPSDLESDSDSEDDTAGTRLLEHHRGRSSTQMKNKSRTVSKRRSKPSLTLATGTQNGSAGGEMNSNIEMHKRDTSLESSGGRASRLMARQSFSLNDDPPITPQTPAMATTSFANLPSSDRRNFLLLCVLYFLQGVPMGLATGSVPFLLKPYLSYGQIGVFSLASYPYSLKLLWSPIVDAVWSQRFGRRKSWITPVQVIAGLAMIYLGGHIEEMMVKAGANGGAGVWNFTYWWFLLVFFCATQDIAVDGWAITLMSPPEHLLCLDRADRWPYSGALFVIYSLSGIQLQGFREPLVSNGSRRGWPAVFGRISDILGMGLPICHDLLGSHEERRQDKGAGQHHRCLQEYVEHPETQEHPNHHCYSSYRQDWFPGQ